MSEIVKVSSKGQITLPARLRKRFNIKPGTYLRFIEGEDDFGATQASQRIASLRGKVAVRRPSGLQESPPRRHGGAHQCEGHSRLTPI